MSQTFEGLRFMTPKAMGTPRSSLTSNTNGLQFSKGTPKHNLFQSREASDDSQMTKSRTPSSIAESLKTIDSHHTRCHTTVSLDASKATHESVSVNSVELELQVAELKAEIKKLKEQYKEALHKVVIGHGLEMGALSFKIEELSEKEGREVQRAQTLSQRNQILQEEKDQILVQYQEAKEMLQDFGAKREEISQLLHFAKEETKREQIRLSEVSNNLTRVQTELSATLTKLKTSEERLSEIKGKEDHWKSLVVTMSQEKTLLNNRISQILEQQAKLESEQVHLRLQQSVSVKQSQSSGETSQEITYLKNRIAQILNQQETGSLKTLYQNKITMMEKEIQQLKARYQSPETLFSHDRTDQLSKNALEENTREIGELKRTIHALQDRITQLNKQIQVEHSKNYAVASFSESEKGSLRKEMGIQKKALQISEEKLKYLVVEGRKKDEFLRQYLSASVSKGEELRFVEEFFRKYEKEIPAQGFVSVSMRETRAIQELEERLRFLSSRLYEQR